MAFPSFEGLSVANDSGDITLPYPAGISAGDELYVLVNTDRDDVTGTTVSDGFSLLSESHTAAGSGSTYGAVFRKIATGAESGSVTVTQAGGQTRPSAAYMLHVSGGDGGAVLVSSDLSTGGDTAPNAPGSTLASGDDYLILYLLAVDANADPWVADPPGSTGIAHGVYGGSVVPMAAWRQVTGAGAVEGDENWSLSAGRDWVAFAVAIKGAVASELNIDPAAPAASTKAVYSPTMEQNLSPIAPAASTAQVFSPTLEQNIEVGAPAASAAAVYSPTVEIAVNLDDWVPVAGHDAYTWQEGAAWTDINIVDDLGLSEDSADIGPAIKTHLDANAGSRIRYIIPEGTYQLTTLLLINRDEKRLVGDGSGNTVIRLSGAGVIKFQGFDGSTTPIVTTAPSRGDTTISVSDPTIASVGETVTIRQTLDNTVTGTDDNTPPYSVGTIVPESWAAQAWEQIVEVTAVDAINDTISFTPALALDYDLGKSPEVKRYNNVYDGSIEGITLAVMEDTGIVALQFDRVRQCLARDVVVLDHAKMGIQVTESFEVEIDRCLVIGARDTGTGGNGYGYCIELGSARVYLHDSVVRAQRHNILLQSGASHNIVAYNYSASPGVENLNDISLHGHNVHHNLIEGNVLYIMEVNDFYTETQRNLIFRNRVMGDAAFWDADTRDYGFWLRRNSTAAIVGNRVETPSVARVFDGSEGSLILLNGNSDAPAGIEDSMYLVAKPADWGVSYVWPPFAGDETNTIPAEDLDEGLIIPTNPADSSKQVFSPTLEQNIEVGAPAASTAQVFSPTLEQNVEVGAPAASTAQVLSPSIVGVGAITAGAPAASTAQVFSPTLEQNIEVGAPAASAAQVHSPSLTFDAGTIGPGAPAASTAAVYSPTLEQNIEVGAPAASTAQVFSPGIAAVGSISAGAPAASNAGVFSPTLEQNIEAGAPAASAAQVHSPSLTFDAGTIEPGAPAASTAAVYSPTLEQNIEAGAPAASVAQVHSPTIVFDGVVAPGAPAASRSQVFDATVVGVGLVQPGAPTASNAGVFSPTLEQNLEVGVPSAGGSQVYSPTLEQSIEVGAPAASAALVFDAAVVGPLALTPAAPAASRVQVFQATVTKLAVADELSVTVAPAVRLTVALAPACDLAVIIKPKSGMGTVIDAGEVVSLTGTFTKSGVAAVPVNEIDLYIERPDGIVDVMLGITVVDNVASAEYTTAMGGEYRWRMFERTGQGVAQGIFKVMRNQLTPKMVCPAAPALTSATVYSPSLAVA